MKHKEEKQPETMTTLNDEVLKGVNNPPEGFFKNYLIDGTTEAVEVRLRALGWDGKQPKASVILHFKAREIKHFQLVISGKRDIG